MNIEVILTILIIFLFVGAMVLGVDAKYKADSFNEKAGVVLFTFAGICLILAFILFFVRVNVDNTDYLIRLEKQEAVLEEEMESLEEWQMPPYLEKIQKINTEIEETKKHLSVKNIQKYNKIKSEVE